KRDSDAERLGGLEVDDQLDLGDLLDGKISRFFAFENAPGVDADLSGAAGAFDRRLAAWWPGGPLCTPYRSTAVVAARSTNHHREPAGRRQQYGHRSRRPCAPRRLYAAPNFLG